MYVVYWTEDDSGLDCKAVYETLAAAEAAVTRLDGLGHAATIRYEMAGASYKPILAEPGAID